MRFEHTEVFNFEGALRGMRNPLNSWAKSDSMYDDNGNMIIGKNDMDLAKRLISGGSEHRKFLRQILVSVDITAPLYWWKEFDTYKIGTTANSTSTMHKLSSTPITKECFEITEYETAYELGTNVLWEDTIRSLENLRELYQTTKDNRCWLELVRLLPNAWLQTRTVTMNYENVRTMYYQRKNHKLSEWSNGFIKWAESLPYAQDLIIQ